ncbi:DUF6076 domain-containing protein [Pygmaiobacter massiliensis]|uniref:DUF6076 domain-containing protein n=1 Tax=Pygmaiobacter massiliensis TaxID=1917873 RepID=UPI002A82FBCE|nr:DUF6076 domain-containing protein [Pygmaiobacter massiliensis]MDY4784391.1 DUF6076 domain-containing protein [Pygmaiobacter massiliensis]
MFGQIDFYIHDNKIELAGQEFLLGELTCDLLNITSEEFAQMQMLAESLELKKDKTILEQLHSLMMKRKLFQMVAGPLCRDHTKLYQAVVADLYAFNQTMFWFIDSGLMHVKKLNSENYAAALFDFYSHPNLHKMMVTPILHKNPQFFMPFDNINVRYVPREIPSQPNNYAIYEVYSADYLQAFLKMDFMKALMVGHSFRRCKNCKRFYLQTDGYKTSYCDRPLADNPKRTCRQQGAKNQAKEKAANNRPRQLYNTAYRRVTADKQRGNITEAEWLLAKKKLADLRDMATSGRLRDAELEALMKSEKLYPSLGIQRKNKR